jgi:hypothetical protein
MEYLVNVFITAYKIADAPVRWQEAPELIGDGTGDLTFSKHLFGPWVLAYGQGMQHAKTAFDKEKCWRGVIPLAQPDFAFYYMGVIWSALVTAAKGGSYACAAGLDGGRGGVAGGRLTGGGGAAAVPDGLDDACGDGG